MSLAVYDSSADSAWARLLADTLDPPRPSKTEVFTTLGYEPNCKPRHEAREAACDVRHRAAAAGVPVGQLPRPCGECPGETDEHLPAPCGNCPQERFHAAGEFDVLFGGAAGGGKTRALLMEGLAACAMHPWLRVGAFRRTYPELEESLLAELAQVEYAQSLGATWNAAKYELRFPNRSLLMFRYAETLVDATRRQGGQYQLLLFDERTLTPPNVVDFLGSRVRSGRADIPVLGIRSGSNPGGPGHAETKRRYIDATDHGKHTIVDERGRTVRFIPSRVTDNPHLNVEYQRDLDVLPEAMRAAFRDGSWESFAGQVFTEWNRDRHVVPEFPIPTEWLRYAGVDYGWTAPTAVLWGARDPDGRVWCYRELTMRRTPERQQAQTVLAAEVGEHVLRRYADPSMTKQTGAALPVSSQYADEGCVLTSADNDRIAGKARVHSFLADGPACAHHRADGWESCPMLHVLDTRCPELVRTLPALPYDPLRVEDVDTKADDHHYDALRYLLMGQRPPFAIGMGAPEQRDRVTVGPGYAARDLPLADHLHHDGYTGRGNGATQRSPWASVQP